MCYYSLNNRYVFIPRHDSLCSIPVMVWSGLCSTSTSISLESRLSKGGGGARLPAREKRGTGDEAILMFYRKITRIHMDIHDQVHREVPQKIHFADM